MVLTGGGLATALYVGEVRKRERQRVQYKNRPTGGSLFRIEKRAHYCKWAPVPELGKRRMHSAQGSTYDTRPVPFRDRIWADGYCSERRTDTGEGQRDHRSEQNPVSSARLPAFVQPSFPPSVRRTTQFRGMTSFKDLNYGETSLEVIHIIVIVIVVLHAIAICVWATVNLRVQHGPMSSTCGCACFSLPSSAVCPHCATSDFFSNSRHSRVGNTRTPARPAPQHRPRPRGPRARRPVSATGTSTPATAPSTSNADDVTPAVETSGSAGDSKKSQ